MAELYLNELTELTSAASTDIIPIEDYDVPDELKKITLANLSTYLTSGINAELDVIMYLGSYLASAGSVEYPTYDGNGNLITAIYKNSGGDTICTVTYTYDGNDLDYSVAAFAAPISLNIKNDYTYDVNKNLTLTTRTLI